MNQSQLREILVNKLGWRDAKVTGECRFKIHCPLAPWEHERGKDRRPSMTVNFDTDGPSIACCYTCGFYAPFYDLLFKLRSLVGGDIAMAEAALLAHKYDQVRTLNIGPRRARQTELKLTDYTSYYVDHLRTPWSPEAIELMDSKNVSMKTARDLYQCAFIPAGYWDENMGFKFESDDPKEMIHDSIAFPIMMRRSGKIKCVGAAVRPLGGSIKYFTMYPYQPTQHLFGQQILHKVKGHPLAIVEGYFDVMHLVQEGLFAAGLNGLHFSPRKALLIKEADPTITLVMLDPDTAGREAAKKVCADLDKAQLTYQNLVLTRDPKHYTYPEIRELAPILPT
jgi:hypothetical protein